MSRVVVVGGGVTGLCSAYYLAKCGQEVALIDDQARQFAGTSSGNAGMIVPSHFTPLAAPGMVGLGLRMLFRPRAPFALKLGLKRDRWRWAMRFIRSANAANVERGSKLLLDLNLASKALYREFANDFKFGYAETGLLMLCAGPKTLAHEVETAERASKFGLKTEVARGPSVRHWEPHAHPELAGGVLFPDDAQIDPAQFVGALRAELEALGVALRLSCRALDWVRHGPRLQAVRAGDETIEADHIVIAAGASSASVLAPLGIRVDLLPGKGYSMLVPADVAAAPTRPAILVEARVAVSPLGKNTRFSGTMELGADSLGVNSRRASGILDAVPRYYKLERPEFNLSEAWSGHRPCTPDGIPYLGRISGLENAVIATGGAMMGMSLGPILGKLAADLTTGLDPSFDLTLLSPDRFR